MNAFASAGQRAAAVVGVCAVLVVLGGCRSHPADTNGPGGPAYDPGTATAAPSPPG